MNFEEAIAMSFDETISSFLVDTRTYEEYALGHIEGALCIPLEELDEIKTFIPDKEAKILLYCRSGRRSGIAKMILEDMGYQDVENIGGIIDYDGPLVQK